MQTPSILFVDDDPNVLSGLRRMMHPFRQEYELNFANSGQEALNLMEQRPSDIIVSDMRMPGMTGAELLRRIYQRYPGTIRFILSGHSDRELIMQSVGFAHQYLAKPCDPETLRTAISRSLALQGLLDNPYLHKKIATIKSLPTPPALYNSLVVELQSEEGSVKSVADIISKDIAMTAKLLQVVNSAFFGLPARVESPTRAVNLLGLDTVRALVLAVGIFEQSQTPPLMHVSLDSIYEHSMEVGSVAKRLGKHVGLDARNSDDALMAGMMHDIGQLVALIHFRDEFREVLVKARERATLLHNVEAEVMGINHSEIGAHLLNMWGLPSSIVEAVAFHHNPSQSVNNAPSVLTVVHLANAFVHQRSDEELVWQYLDGAYLEKLGLKDRVLELRSKSIVEM